MKDNPTGNPTGVLRESTIPEGADMVICDHFSGEDTEIRKLIVGKAARLRYVGVCTWNANIQLDIQSLSPESDVVCHLLVVAEAWWSPVVQVRGFLQASHTRIEVHMVSFLLTWGKSAMDGSILISPDIVKASWHLLEENIILGERVQIKTLPMLDVRSNDVSASHGARIEKLDAKKLFYLESKWISPQDAKRLMVEGYVDDLLSILDQDEQKMRTKDVVMWYILAV